MSATQNMLLLVCVGVSLAHDLITPEQLKSIEARLAATEKTLEELKRENKGKYLKSVFIRNICLTSPLQVFCCC